MGSPSLALKLSPRFRPWHSAGLTHLLLGKEAVRARLSSCVATPRVAPPRPGVGTPAAQHAPHRKTATQAPDNISFPVPWDYFWSKTTPRAQVVFTYQHLSLDLLGKGDRRRGQLFREILQHLQWTGKGIFSFWPLNDGTGSGAVAQDANLFWQGVSALGAAHVACFGAKGFEAIMGQTPPSQGVAKHAEVTVHLLPSPERLLTLLPHERHMASDVLSSIRLKT